MSNLVKFRSVHSGRLERWLGRAQIDFLGQQMKGWYGPPIHLLDCPGSVRVGKDGDFIGPFSRGVFMSAIDSLEQFTKRALRVPQYSFNAGFTSVGDAITRGRQGHWQQVKYNKLSTVAGLALVTESMHKLGSIPEAGIAASAAPGGIAYTTGDIGSLKLVPPATGTLRLVAAEMQLTNSFVVRSSTLIYDRIFGVAKTMNSTATEAVTGVPTRYQDTSPTAEDYIGGNFGFIETGLTLLAATAHNWSVCTYLDDTGAASTLPDIVGTSATPAHSLDHPIYSWFTPLEAGDVGMKAWTQMQCGALVATGTIDFVIGHPIGFMSFPLETVQIPFDWLTNRSLAPRIFNNAYLSTLVLKPVNSAGGVTGQLNFSSTAS